MKIENMENDGLKASKYNRCRLHRVNHAPDPGGNQPIRGSVGSAASPASAAAARPVAAGTIC